MMSFPLPTFSRGLINVNIMKINQIISTITFINDTMDSLMNQLRPLFSARRFLLLHTELLIHHSRIRSLLGQMKTNTAKIKAYLNIHITGKLTPSITDPVHLRQELLQINKQLPTRLSLPKDPHRNIWHYYRFLTVSLVMNLCKIYNLPIYNHCISRSLTYQLEETNLAIAKDNKYATILSDTEFIRCTLADGHFCDLNTDLYHVDTNQWCVTAIFFKDNDKISTYCRVAICNITGPQANYLDQGLWAFSVETPISLEIKCEDHSQVKTLQPPITLINLQPACSAFSSTIKLPPYFKWYSKGFHVALKSANLPIPEFKTSSFRVWTHFDLSNVTKPEIENLKKLAPAPNIPIDQFRAQIAKCRHINPDTDRPWIYYVGGGSGSGLVLLIVICSSLYWCCKRTQSQETRLPACVTNAAPQNTNMLHIRVGAIGTDKYSVPGWETVGIQDTVGTQCKVLSDDMLYAFVTALLDQLEDYGTNVQEHCRRLRTMQYTAKPQNEAKPSLEIQSV